MPGRDNRFTIYDALEKSGYFDKNPANSYARDMTDGSTLYKGPVQFPMMLYHPEGSEKIIVPAEIVSTPMGAKEVGEQRELEWKIVQNEAEMKGLLADGWHTHPAKAVRARVELLIAKMTEDGKLDDKTKAKLLASIPTMSSDQRIKDLEAELARLTFTTDAERAARAEDNS